ncbi:xanthine dehydrogenase molybdenum-binding subunit XdhA [Lachnoclostridium pacaense]|uniref:xanthine dehydrogenase subunit XdhA n=1 Tax=Enterocloster hominis (ex Hitch et al. 2024) TaxID=1917870 RepID=UPI001D10D9D8|nr:xanthine dehydrogenase subunit XdhA [Lachnoclostridium pacaense]MCC2879260.1 xanthine dehydrogenase molybdenum-binding subunit XdhA [Lachnoclostridium pacaense]
MNIVGKSVNRVDAYGKVTGEAKYTADLEPKDCLCAKVVHSTIANGLVKSFDLEEALKVPGVVKIVTCFDVPDYQFPTAGHPWSVEKAHQDIADRKLLNQRVRLYGDDIAAIIGENEVACQQAARLIKVEYEEYDPLVTVRQAMEEGATPLHPDLRKDNVIVHSHLTMGPKDFTFEDGLKAAEDAYGKDQLTVIERDYHTPRISHCHIELPVSWAYVEPNGKITVTSSTQIPHIVRRVISQALGVPAGRIRVIKPYIGGGFGNKQDVLYEPLNAYLTTVVGGRPVRLEISREETIYGTRTRHAIDGSCKAVVTKDGKMLARKLEAYANNGGYASHGHAICANCGNVFKDIYADRLGAEIDCYTVWTSTATAGAMRGYGIPQAAFFSEALTDDICHAIGADPLRFRLENCMPEGFVDPANGITFYSYGLKKCMEKGADYIGWDERRRAYANQTGPVRRGIGMAIFCYKTGVYPISLETASARMILNQDGSIQVQLGATEIGQGADTVFSQMAAQTTGISFEHVYIVSTQDTDTAPFDTGAYASRQTYVSGMAVKKCGEALKARILDYASFMLDGRPVDELDVDHDFVIEKETGKELIDMPTLAVTAFYSLERSEHITAEVTNQCRDNSFASGCCFVDVEVDMPLGKVTVKEIVNVHDSGMLMNPKLAEAQVHGGMSMGLGYGLSEEFIYSDKGKPLNDNLLDYKIPTAMDTPDLNVKFIQLDDPTGPYGNKSLGEPPTIPVAPALRNAVLHATGVAMDTIPMTPQRLIGAFQEKGLI